MLWAEDIPVYGETDLSGREIEVTVIAGRIGEVVAPAPAPDSWANDPENEVAIWLIQMDAHAQWTIPAASLGVKRSLYFYRGSSITLSGIKC